MQIKTFKRIAFFLSLGLISISLAGCGSGGGGGGVALNSGNITPALFSGWEMTNGPFSGRVSSLAVDPTDSQKIYAAVEIGGLFNSSDGGKSWVRLKGKLENLSVSAVAVGADGQTIYIGTKGNGIFMTINGGTTWVEVNNGLPKNPQAPDQYYMINEIVIDPTDDGIVYAILATSYYLYRTTNGGNGWDRVGLDLPSEPIEVIVAHPANPQVLYAGTYSNGVWKSMDRGDSWDEINGNLDLYIVHFVCLAVDPDNNILYAGSKDYGLYRTLDDGITWEFIEVGSNTVSENWDAGVLVMDPIDKSIIYTYVETVDPVQPSDDGIYRTFDRGGRWEKVPFHEYPNTYRPVREIDIAPSDGSVVYVSTQKYGLFMTNDAMGVERVEDWVPLDNGLVDLPVYSLLMHPWNNSVVYAGTDDGLFKTTDGGLTWEREGLRDLTVYAIVFDPSDPNIIYAATTSGVYKTENGGNSWYDPADSRAYYCLAVGKDFQDRNIIYGGSAFGNGIYKALDDGSVAWGGISWQEMNNGLSDDEKYVHCFAIDLSNPSVLYAGTGYRRWPGPETVGKIIKTRDGGNTWEKLVDGLPPDEPICSLSIDPSNPSILYAGTYVGLYASSDNGNHWEFKGLGSDYVRSLAIDPMDSRRVCAGTFDQGVFASSDGGERWKKIDNGLTSDLSKRVISLAMDVSNIDNPVIYAGTGCGVFKAYK